MRKGNYKLLFDHQGYLELYDLSRDLSEENNLADSMPEKARQLFSEMVGWLDDTVPERYLHRPNPLYSPEENAESAAPPYRNLRKLSVKTAPKPVAKKPSPQPNAPSLIRTWPKGKQQQKDGSFVKMFVNPKGKKIVTLRLADRTEVNISHKVLTPKDITYLESIQVKVGPHESTK